MKLNSGSKKREKKNGKLGKNSNPNSTPLSDLTP